MSSSTEPLVSVVIPVYNGERFIADAIRSVLAQTYTNWDLTIGNNCSNDRTVAIAEEFVASHPRIRISTYPKFVSVVDSHNNAFNLISDDAKYVKILDADDTLFPNCIEELVRVAEAYPSVGMVASYVLAGSRVAEDGLPYPGSCVPGREVCRLRLLRDIHVFGGPSSSLIKASIARSRKPFYNPLNYGGDAEAYLELLRDHDFGFVHQVLSCRRMDEESRTTSYLERVGAAFAGKVDEATKFGPVYLTEQECALRLKKVKREYDRFMGWNVWEFRGREFWDYHLKDVKALGYPPNYARIAGFAALRFLDLIGNPVRTVQGALRRLTGLRSRRTTAAVPVHGPAPSVQPQGPAPSASAHSASVGSR